MEDLRSAFRQQHKSLMKNEQYREAYEAISQLTPEEREQYIQARINKRNKQDWDNYYSRQRTQFLQNSIWGGSGKQTFTFNQWLPERQRNVSEAKALKNKSIAIAKDICEGGRGRNILVQGSAGTGKTALVLAMLDAFQKRTDKTVMFVSTVALSDKIHDFYNDQTQERLRRVKELMKKADILVLDDFGSESGGMSSNKLASEPLQRFYFEVGESRQTKDKNGLKRLTTIVTTNNTGRELVSMFNEKILSRIVAKNPDNQLIFSDMEDLRD